MKLTKPKTKWGISRGFGKGHNGIDYKYPEGTKVTAAAAGVIDFEGYGANDPWTLAMGGIYVRIKHPDGSYTGYAHLRRTVVDKGQKVKAGKKIGESGQTGYATGPHLHFEVIPKKQDWNNGYSARINPEPFFAKPSKYPLKGKTTKYVAKHNTYVRKSPKISAKISGSKLTKKGKVFNAHSVETGQMVNQNGVKSNKWLMSRWGNYTWAGNYKKK